MEQLSVDLQRFIAACIESVEHLEVLLLVRYQPARSWTGESVSRELGVTTEAADAILESLSACNLLDVRVAHDVVYRFAPGTAELAALAGELAEAYQQRRLAVLACLTRGPSRSIRDFADAFRLKPRR